MKMTRLVCKKTFALISCVLIIFSSCFQVSASQNNSVTLKPTVVLGSSSTAVSQVCPITPMFYSHSGSTTEYGSYGGIFTVTYTVVFEYPDLSGLYVFTSGLIGATANLQIVADYRYAITSGFYQNIVVSAVDTTVIDASGNSYATLMNDNLSVNLTTYPGSSPSYGVDVGKLRTILKQTGSVWPNEIYIRSTYAVSSYFPLRYAVVTSPSGPYSATFTPFVGDSAATPAQLDQVNSKLDNLTSGFNSGSIDDTNQQLGNNLDSFDQAEDAALSSVTNYFDQIEQPISFFNAGAFLTSTSFVWTYLQGIYEHLGDAKIVVDVVLALTVAFSFIGLGKYIWRVADREDDS